MRVADPDRVRRRLLPLVGVALVALIVGVFAGSRDEGSDPAGDTTDGSRAEARRPGAAPRALSLRQQVGQTMILSFAGTSPPGYVRKVLSTGEASGVVLFAGNVRDAAQVRTLGSTLQRAARGGALVSVDQEGGSIRNLPFAAPAAGQPVQGTPVVAREAASAAARDLDAAGVNVTLAPVVDVTTGAGSFVAGRAFPGAAAAVSAITVGALAGYEGTRVASTVKHFPGLGAATRSTDDVPVTIDRSRQELERVELAPFRAAVAADAPLVMASHALYPALDSRSIASQSRPILVDLLRRRMGFRGAVITDSLEARAVLERSSVEEAAVRSLRAGADLMLTTGRGSYRPVYDRLLAEAERSPEFRRRVEESAGRVLQLKRRLGLRPPRPAG